MQGCAESPSCLTLQTAKPELETTRRPQAAEDRSERLRKYAPTTLKTLLLTGADAAIEGDGVMANLSRSGCTPNSKHFA